jgi:lambda family phage portal protein
MKFDEPLFSPGASAMIERNVAARQAPAAPRRGQRMYGAALQTRLTANWQAQTGSSDSELWSSLTTLRNRSRQLVRDTPYAKRAKTVIVNNTIGSGIKMEPKVVNQRGNQIKPVNADISAAWNDWTRAENCHTGGKLHFCDLERMAFGEIVEAGEIVLRKHYQPFGSSKVPFAIEVIEGERLADDAVTPVSGGSQFYRMGVDRDVYGRPTGFFIRRFHPGEVRYAGPDPNLLERVPAEQIFHLYIISRWPQTRGEPWLHTAMRRLNDMDGYSEAEIVAARAAACYMGIITTPDESGMADGPAAEGGVPEFELAPGAVPRLAPGELWNEHNPNRPNSAMDPFMRLMLREVAAGADVSYESLSRDYSQSNFSSSRLALLDDRDLWRVFQQFFIRNFREPLHREWLQQAIYARAIQSVSVSDYLAQPSKFEAVSFKPRGWGWIDPVKEVQAYKDARRAGFISTARIIAATADGADRDEIWTEIAEENADAEAKGITVTTDPGVILEGRESDATLPDPAANPNADAASASDGATPGDAYARALTEVAGAQRELALSVSNMKAPVVNISPQPVVVNTPDVKVEVAAPQIHLEMPQRSELDQAEILERDDNRLARVIRTNRGDFEITERDANGDAKRMKRKSA